MELELDLNLNLNLDLDIGNTLRKYRVEQRYTQQNVADHLDISRQAYVKWENNVVDFSMLQLQKIAVLYNKPLHIIIKESYLKKRIKYRKGPNCK